MGSAEDLADKLGTLLTEPNTWDRLRECAPQPISHEEAARQHLELYRKLAEADTAPQAVAGPAGEPS
jgi:hypothetical protein